MVRIWAVTFDYRADIDAELAGRLAEALVDELPADVASAAEGFISVTFNVEEETITAALDPAERRRVVDILALHAPGVLWRIVRAEAVDYGPVTLG